MKDVTFFSERKSWYVDDLESYYIELGVACEREYCIEPGVAWEKILRVAWVRLVQCTSQQ